MWNGFNGMICDWDGWSSFWPLHFVLPLSFWALIIMAVVIAVRYASAGGWSSSSRLVERRPPSLDVLAERYTRGEINRDEFLQKKRDIFG
jgi:putative membrane protein